MAKPSITKRITKTAALTYSELDANFQNLADATLTLRAGTGGTNVTADLNGTITLVAGTGVTLSGDNSAKTVTIASSSAQNIFSTIAVAGQSNVVADSTSDTLTLVAGSNVTLTTNATTDTVTIAAASPSTNATTVTITDSSTTNTAYNMIFADDSGNVRKDTRLTYNPNLQTISSGIEDLNLTAGASSAITLSASGSSQFASGGPLLFSATLFRISNGALRLSLYSNSASVSSPENGMIIYNTTTHKFQGYANGAWVDLH